MLLECLLLIFSRSAFESITLSCLGGQAGVVAVLCLRSYTEAVRNALFSLQICHGVVDSCQVCKYELTLFRLDPHDELLTYRNEQQPLRIHPTKTVYGGAFSAYKYYKPYANSTRRSAVFHIYNILE
jgi:hypothetical protein